MNPGCERPADGYKNASHPKKRPKGVKNHLKKLNKVDSFELSEWSLLGSARLTIEKGFSDGHGIVIQSSSETCGNLLTDFTKKFQNEKVVVVSFEKEVLFGESFLESIQQSVKHC